MKTLTIYGSSDDLIEMDGIRGATEFCICSDDDIIGSFQVGGKIRIHAIYDNNGCWCFAIGKVDEGVPLPDWPIRITNAKNDYSTYVEIDVPDDVSLVREHRERTN